MIFPITVPSALAFDGKYHDQSAQEGLGGFLREGVLRDLKVQRLWADETYPSFRGTQDQIYFDDCEFNGSAKFIRDRYRAAISGLADNKLWVASENFGRLLHTVQDFYSHSNWVELFPLHGGKVTQADLVDLGGADATLAKHWYAPAGGEVVRGDIMLGADDWEPLAKGWAVKRNGSSSLVPILIDPQGRTRGRLLVTGRGTADDECHVQAFVTSTKVKTIYTGIDHETLNKDGPEFSAIELFFTEVSRLKEAGVSDLSAELNKSVELKRLKHERALRLATLQTGYEWCRLVREAGLANRDGLLLALWVKPGKNPHPRETPCAHASPGRAGIVVTIESIRIRNAHDGEGKAGDSAGGSALR